MVRPKNGKINCDGKERRKKKTPIEYFANSSCTHTICHVFDICCSAMHILCVQLLACADRSCSRIAVVRQPRMIQQWDLFLSVFFFSVCVCRLNDSYRLPHRVVWHTHNLCVIDSREVKKSTSNRTLFFSFALFLSSLVISC